MCVHASFVSVDVGEETPRTVCSGLVGSVPLEELQVWPFNSNERMELKKQNKQNKSNENKKTSSCTFEMYMYEAFLCKLSL